MRLSILRINENIQSIQTPKPMFIKKRPPIEVSNEY